MSAGGRHILCSPELIEAVDKKNITDEDEGIEVELNASGRPKRKCAGKGVERLEMQSIMTRNIQLPTTRTTSCRLNRSIILSVVEENRIFYSLSK